MKDAQASEKEKDQATEKEKEKGAQFTVKAAQATKNTAKGMYVYCSIVLCVYYGICNSCALGNRGQRKKKVESTSNTSTSVNGKKAAHK